MARIDYTKDGEKVICGNYMPGSIFMPIKHLSRVQIVREGTIAAQLDVPATYLSFPYPYQLTDRDEDN